ncbi:30S ribosomal protein S3 [candidate division GN15 bacterium]|uniref:Small ribosomal subunit protein uS3 n=1 Tax=candidate division GN15 bacterium TaxID=2072418 RepID=A0A855X9C2_9BACT|nr:MAG: 30S ribosomal protein S3 [candidate division GN15 bacterium]
MGQKTNPVGLRLGIIKTWNSRWYAPDRNVADLVHEDMLIKRYISRRLDNAGISNVLISRAPKKVTVDIMTARPGIVIGRRGAEVDKLREELQLLTKKDILLNIVEVRKPELDSKLVADSIAKQLEGRISFRRAMKKAMAATMKMGAEGIKIQCGGRLGGAEIARSEKYMEGRVPLHTLRADIDYATSTAVTTYGTIGVKVWICRGEILDQAAAQRGDTAKQEQESRDILPGDRPGRGRDAGGDRGARRRPRGRVRREPGGEGRPARGRRPDMGPRRPAGEQSDRGGENA